MMRKRVEFSHRFVETMRQLGEDGLLLVATKPSGESNVMTIGWGTIGLIWGRPIFTVLVRPSRYTYEFIEESGEFSVNVPTPDMRDFVFFCGTRSGRDHDKFGEFGVRVTPAQAISAVTIEACPLVYECRVVQKNDVVPDAFDPAIVSRFYPRGDFHRAFYGEILGTWSV